MFFFNFWAGGRGLGGEGGGGGGDFEILSFVGLEELGLFSLVIETQIGPDATLHVYDTFAEFH